MIHYETGVYAVTYALRWRLWNASVVGQAALWAFACAISSVGVCQLVGPGVDTGDSRTLWSSDAKIVLGVHAFILGTIMAFRVNQAFQRYWECATRVHQIKSRWSNAAGMAFTFCTAADEKQEAVDKFQDGIVRLTSMMFCAALNDLERTKHRKQVINNEGMDLESLRFLDQVPDRVEVILRWLQSLAWNAHRDGTLEGPANLLAMLLSELNAGRHDFVYLRTILETPIPYPYAHLLTVLVLAHCFVTVMSSPYVFMHDTMAFAATFLSVFAYAGAYYLAHSIERPFGRGVNDLPWDEYAKEMNQSLFTMLDDRAQNPPVIHFDPMNSHLTVRECISFVGDSEDDHDCVPCGHAGEKQALSVPPSACKPLERKRSGILPGSTPTVSMPELGMKIRGHPRLLSCSSSRSLGREDEHSFARELTQSLTSEIGLEFELSERASWARDAQRLTSTGLPHASPAHCAQASSPTAGSPRQVAAPAKTPGGAVASVNGLLAPPAGPPLGSQV
mmetsp:Transcript_3758/g.10474  ORF Transcript_3758/g.10474 Transcript_3758/m.10474 type:complete len:505 (-) Transcript_3758:233-1747(-)